MKTIQLYFSIVLMGMLLGGCEVSRPAISRPPGEPVVIVVSPSLDAEFAEELRDRVFSTILASPSGQHIAIVDGNSLEGISQFAIPDLRYPSEKALFNALRQELSEVQEYFKNRANKQGDQPASGFVDFPRVMGHLARQIDTPTRVTVIGSPVWDSPAEDDKAFSMAGDQLAFPHDVQFTNNPINSPFGCEGIDASRLSVIYITTTNKPITPREGLALADFYARYCNGLRAKLVEYTSDLATGFEKALSDQPLKPRAFAQLPEMDNVGPLTMVRLADIEKASHRKIEQPPVTVAKVEPVSTTSTAQPAPPVSTTTTTNKAVTTEEPPKQTTDPREIGAFPPDGVLPKATNEIGKVEKPVEPAPLPPVSPPPSTEPPFDAISRKVVWSSNRQSVLCDVMVHDRNGRFVRGLRDPDFQVRMFGAPAKVSSKYVHQESESNWIVLAIDRSLSMRRTRLEEVVKAANRFLEELKSSPTTFIKIISFGEDVQSSIVWMTPSQAITELEKLRVKGDTPMFEAIDLAIKELQARSGDRYMVLFGDGRNNGGGHLKLRDLLTRLHAKQVTTYAVGLKSGGLDSETLAQVSGPSRYFEVKELSGLLGAFHNASQAIGSREYYRLQVSQFVPIDNLTPSLEIVVGRGDSKVTINERLQKL